MSTEPADADPGPDGPTLDTVGDLLDDPGDFVSRNDRERYGRKESLLGDRIAVAHAARLNFHAHFAEAGLRPFALY
jgi:hypothetical protein